MCCVWLISARSIISLEGYQPVKLHRVLSSNRSYYAIRHRIPSIGRGTTDWLVESPEGRLDGWSEPAIIFTIPTSNLFRCQVEDAGPLDKLLCSGSSGSQESAIIGALEAKAYSSCREVGALEKSRFGSHCG